jgi:hypothetical protein
MPPKKKSELPELDLGTSPAVKTAYRAFTSSLPVSIQDAANHLWEKEGGVAATDPNLCDRILNKISSLSEILPVYADALVGLALEEQGNDNCLTWWRIFKTQINTCWFDVIFPRLPRSAMGKSHDENYYLMENQDWMRKAALYVLKNSFALSGLFATHGTPVEQQTMQDEIEWDKEEEGKRSTVYEDMAMHRLGDLKGCNDLNMALCKGIFADSQTSAKFLYNYEDNRKHQLLKNSVHVEGDDDDATEIDHNAMADLAVLNADRLEDITKAVERQNGMLALLHHDLATMRTKKGSSGSAAADMPAWMKACDAAVLALDEDEGMCFETNGVSETDAQRKGRKQRDSIYAKYSDLWKVKELSWTKFPPEQKTGIYVAKAHYANIMFT